MWTGRLAAMSTDGGAYLTIGHGNCTDGRFAMGWRMERRWVLVVIGRP